jgi:hypothetical protein
MWKSNDVPVAGCEVTGQLLNREFTISQFHDPTSWRLWRMKRASTNVAVKTSSP